jgi:hypothetical protein
VTQDGSAKPVEVAQALGLAGSGDLRAEGPRIARLGLVGAAQAGLADPLTSLVILDDAGRASAVSPPA